MDGLSGEVLVYLAEFLSTPGKVALSSVSSNLRGVITTLTSIHANIRYFPRTTNDTEWQLERAMAHMCAGWPAVESVACLSWPRTAPLVGLQRLQLLRCGFLGECDYLHTIQACGKALQWLQVVGCTDFFDKDCTALSITCPNIRGVSIEDCLDVAGSRMLSEVGKCPSLEVFVFLGGGPGGVWRGGEFPGSCSRLHTLVLSGLHIPEQAFSTVSSCVSLQIVYLTNVHFTSGEATLQYMMTTGLAILSVSAASALALCPALEDVTIGDISDIECGALECLIGGRKSIRTVYLHVSESITIGWLPRYLPKGLLSLRLHIDPAYPHRGLGEKIDELFADAGGGWYRQQTEEITYSEICTVRAFARGGYQPQRDKEQALSARLRHAVRFVQRFT